MEASESSFLEDNGEIYRAESAKEDMKYMQEASIYIGSLSIVFSLVFVWNAVELGTYSILITCFHELRIFYTHSVLSTYKQRFSYIDIL